MAQVPLRELQGRVVPIMPIAPITTLPIIPARAPARIQTVADLLQRMVPTLQPNYIQALLAMIWRGQQLLSLDDPQFVYNIAGFIRNPKGGFESTYTYLTDPALQEYRSKDEILFMSPLLKPARDKADIDAEILRNKVLVTKGVKCRRCGSSNTISAEKQIRSADEPMTVIVSCLNCGNRTKY